MRILMAHNFYQQPGGEDISFAAEQRLLVERGHSVIPYTLHNDAIEQMSRLAVAVATFWNRDVYRSLDSLFETEGVQLAHFQNTFPLISPAAYYAARKHGVAVVQSLRNYRLLCLNSYFLREGRVCEKCMHTWAPWPGIVHACYRDSRAGSGVVAGMLTFHRLLKTWHNTVDAYIALTEFARNKYIEGGLPAHKIYVKPNFLSSDPGMRTGVGDYALFVGRLSFEKGIDTLLEAWTRLDGIPLKIAGSGPMVASMEKSIARHGLTKIELLGHLGADELVQVLKNARCLVFPSECYEGFPRTILEAFACGVPVIASNLGSMSELIVHNETGLHFAAGDAAGLAAQVDALWGDSAMQKRLGENARPQYTEKFTAESNYRMTMEIYESIIASKRYS